MSRKHYAKSIYKMIAARSFRGQWGGQVRRYTAPCHGGAYLACDMHLRPPSAGISLGSTSEVLNVMWLARRLDLSRHTKYM